MAATRLIALHLNKGKTPANCLADRIVYAENPDKTDNGTLITSYRCDPATAAAEFLLSKREYLQKTGKDRGDVIAYQIRQSFKPGEIDPEEANQIGYELAMSFTKGNHAFIVATHTDRAHIHNHVIFNSTNLSCDGKFKNFWKSGLALQRISDIVCLQHGLSVISPLPFSERTHPHTFLKSFLSGFISHFFDNLAHIFHPFRILFIVSCCFGEFFIQHVIGIVTPKIMHKLSKIIIALIASVDIKDVLSILERLSRSKINPLNWISRISL